MNWCLDNRQRVLSDERVMLQLIWTDKYRCSPADWLQVKRKVPWFPLSWQVSSGRRVNLNLKRCLLSWKKGESRENWLRCFRWVGLPLSDTILLASSSFHSHRLDADQAWQRKTPHLQCVCMCDYRSNVLTNKSTGRERERYACLSYVKPDTRENIRCWK